MIPVSLILLGLFPAAVIVAALRDLTSFTIPNWISLALIAAFGPVALIVHVSALGVIGCLATGGGALLLGMVMFSLGWIGGGDAKLFAAAALWLGWPAVLPFMLWTSVAGGALAVALLWSRKFAPAQVHAGPAWVGQLMAPKGDVPYGLAIAAGALFTFPMSALVSG